MDAADDLREDLAEGNFNPLIRTLDLSDQKVLEGEDRSRAEAVCNEMLNLTAARICAALNLLEWNRFGPIIANVIEKGLPEMQREILFLHAKEKKNVRSI